MTKWWTGENTRNNNSPLLAIGSNVRVVAQAADKQGDGEPPKKKTSATDRETNQPMGVGQVASRNEWRLVVVVH